MNSSCGAIRVSKSGFLSREKEKESRHDEGRLVKATHSKQNDNIESKAEGNK